MKLHLKFHCFVIVIGLLLCNAPLTTFAQQQINIDTVTAKGDAALDAENDISKITWMGVGVCVPILSLATGVVAAYTFEDTESSGGSDYFGNPSVPAFFGGAGLVFCGASYFIYSHKTVPPPEHLLGKSPEYIQDYTTAYQKAMRSLRIKYALAGVGCFRLVGLGP